MSGTSTDTTRPVAHTLLQGGRYALVRKLAEGGTAIVHLGWDEHDKQWRAIKTLLPEYARRPALRHRFENEARTMQALVHPNIVTVYDAGQEGETAYLVMELAEGGSVIDWVERHGRMPARMACQVVLDVCAGMAYAHDHGVIHRDIKPQNVLVAADGVCKVTDFGIAQIVEETRMTMTGTVMGTLGYMAPEQHESAKHADARADIYSLAATLYTLLMGEAPTHLFMADDRDFEGIAPPVVEVIRKGSQYRRELRFESMHAFHEALAAARDTLPPDPEAPPLSRPNRLPLELEPPTGGSVEPPSHDPASVGSGGPPVVAGALPPPFLRPKSKPSEEAQPLVTAPAPSLARITIDEDQGQRSRRLRPSTVHETRASDDRRRRLLAALGAGVVFVVMGLALVVLVGATRINAFVQLSEHADVQLVAQVHEERVILDALESAGIEPTTRATIRELFDACERVDREDREASATRLVALLDSVRRDVEARRESRSEHLVKQLQQTVRRLQQQLQEVQRTQGQLDEIRQSPSGKLATMVGL
jgi:serine/threonine protein kinase